jgi:hypothetical protein
LALARSGQSETVDIPNANAVVPTILRLNKADIFLASGYPTGETLIASPCRPRLWRFPLRKPTQFRELLTAALLSSRF